MGHGYEQVSVNEVREELRKLGVDEETLKQNKKALINLLLEKKENRMNEVENTEVSEVENSDAQTVESPTNLENPELDVLENAEEEVEVGVVNAELDAEDQQPTVGSPKWQEYVMSLFHEGELQDGYPMHHGLIRVAEELIGPVVDRQITTLHPPCKENGFTSTVVVSLVFTVYNDGFGSSSQIKISDAADAGKYNTDPPYSAYPTSLAVTRAESRALRRILRLKTVSAEETSKIAEETSFFDLDEENGKITDQQITVLDLMSKRLNVDAVKYVNSGSQTYENVRDVPRQTAAKMIKALNDLQNNKEKISESIVGYKADWSK